MAMNAVCRSMFVLVSVHRLQRSNARSPLGYLYGQAGKLSGVSALHDLRHWQLLLGDQVHI